MGLPTRRHALHWWIMLGLLLGVALGVGLNLWWTPDTWRGLGVGDARAFLAGTTPAVPDANAQAGPAAHAVKLIASVGQFIADLFLRLLRLIAVPVILFSLVAAVSGVGDLRRLGRVGGKTVLVFALTAVSAVVIGLVIVNLAKPGAFVSDAARTQLLTLQSEQAQARIQSAEQFAPQAGILRQVLDAFPANPFAALASGNMLQVVTLSILLGIGLTMLSSEQRTRAHAFFDTLAQACLKMVGVLLWLAPAAVFVLSAALVVNLGLSVLAAAGVFVGVTAGGLALVIVGVYFPMMFLLTPRGNRMTPGRFLRAMAPAKLLAFSSSSSAATLPVTMECTRGLGVSERVTGLVLPLGTTINMDGTALYQVMSVIFLAQLFGVDLSAAQQATVALMAILVAIGSPGLPGASLVMMVFILEAVGVPVQGLAVILAVDRVLDMCRTVVNVTGDAAAAVVVASSEGELSSPQPAHTAPPSESTRGAP